MATRRYKLDGVRVPSVTTVLGVIAKPALIHWAWRCGIDGKDYRKERSNAADIGTMTHELVAAWFGGDTHPGALLPPGEDCDKARELFHKLKTYAEAEGWEPIELEDCDGKAQKAEIALVSETYGYGGTMDAVIRDGKIWIWDLKTSAKAYDEHFCQGAAYAKLVEENTGITPDGIRIVCVPREGGGITIFETEDIDTYWQVFMSALALYRWQKRIKGADGHEIGSGNGVTNAAVQSLQA